MPALSLINNRCIKTRFAIGIHIEYIRIYPFILITYICHVDQAIFIISVAIIFYGQSVVHKKLIDRFLRRPNCSVTIVNITGSGTSFHQPFITVTVIGRSPKHLFIITLEQLIQRFVYINCPSLVLYFIQSMSFRFRKCNQCFHMLTGSFPLFHILFREYMFARFIRQFYSFFIFSIE